MSKHFHKACKSYDETLDTIANINARDGFTVWHIESFKDNISLPVFEINIVKQKEKIRKSNNWTYTLHLTFLYSNGQRYTYIYKDIYLKRLLEQRFQIIQTRLRQAYQEREN